MSIFAVYDLDRAGQIFNPLPLAPGRPGARRLLLSIITGRLSCRRLLHGLAVTSRTPARELPDEVFERLRAGRVFLKIDPRLFTQNQTEQCFEDASASTLCLTFAWFASGITNEQPARHERLNAL